MTNALFRRRSLWRNALSTNCLIDERQKHEYPILANFLFNEFSVNAFIQRTHVLTNPYDICIRIIIFQRKQIFTVKMFWIALNKILCIIYIKYHTLHRIKATSITLISKNFNLWNFCVVKFWRTNFLFQL